MKAEDFPITTVFSPDRIYRYTLWRCWRKDGLIPNVSRLTYAMFIGLNPSTADETKNDPTIRKCIGFAKRWGLDALCMTNLFAFRATDPRVMKQQADPIGEDNDKWLKQVAHQASVIVAAWGLHGAHNGRDKRVTRMIGDVRCLRYTKDGFPEHPLYVPYDTALQFYPRKSK